METLRTKIEEFLEDEAVVIYDGLDAAIVGVGNVHGQEKRLVYCYNKLIEVHMEDHDMTYEEAVEYIDFNVVCAYVGDTTPLIMYCCEKEGISKWDC
jgi:hypothetical protein